MPTLPQRTDYTTWVFWTGMIIVIGTHAYMLFSGLPSNLMAAHAILNLIAGGLILLVWFKR